MKNKKIAFIIGSLSGGGAEQVCVTLANNFAKLEYEVELIVLHLKDSKYLNRVSNKVKLINLNTNRVRYSFWKLFKYLYGNKPEITIIFDYQITLFVNVLNIFISPRIKIVSRCMNTLSHKLKSNNILLKYFNKILIKSAYNYSDLIISQSEGMKKDLVNNFRINKTNIKVINNPLNELIESNINRDINPKENYLLCIGRLEEQKNFNLVIEAFSKIKNRYPNLKLKIAGTGSLRKELIELSKKLEVSDRVEFLGFISGINLINCYRNARLTLLTSLFEGFPNCLIESIALGTPVVSVNCPSGPSEIIINNVNGILVKGYQVKDFSEAIIKGLEINWDYKTVRNTSVRYFSNPIINEYSKAIAQLLC